MNRKQRRSFARSQSRNPQTRRDIARALKSDLAVANEVPTEPEPPLGVSRRASGLIVARGTGHLLHRPGRER